MSRKSIGHIDDLIQFLTGPQNTESVIFENCDFGNVSDLTNYRIAKKCNNPKSVWNTSA